MLEAIGDMDHRQMADHSNDPREQLLQKIKEAFDADPQAFLNQTANLRTPDVTMIGTVVQLYCFADFNARRLVNALQHAATGKPRSTSRLQDAQVFPALRVLALKQLPDSNIQQGILKALDTLEMHRVHRHNFAHWAARRIKGVEALILFSSNAREAEKRNYEAHEPGEATYGILPLEGFDGEVRKLRDHTNYLARTAAHVEQHIAEFAVEIAEHQFRTADHKEN